MQAAVPASRAERRYHVRRIAQEYDSAMQKPLHASAMERVYRDPFDIEARRSDDLLDPWRDALRTAFLFRVGIGSKLQIDPIDVVGLLVEKRRLAVVKGRFEPEAALRRKVEIQLDVRDQKSLFENFAFKVQPQFRADR